MTLFNGFGSYLQRFLVLNVLVFQISRRNASGPRALSSAFGVIVFPSIFVLPTIVTCPIESTVCWLLGMSVATPAARC